MASQQVAGYDRPVSPLSIDEPASPPCAVANEPKAQATVTDNLPKDAGDEDGERAGTSTYHRTGKTVVVDIIIVAVIASLAMSVSFGLIFHIQFNISKGFTQAEPIRGRFSSLWTKLIDADCSIVIAPGLLALAN
ncbi:hypothetical protein ACHAPT_013637 [Fusarium lateritium]